MRISDQVGTMVFAFDAGDRRRDFVRDLASEVRALEDRVAELEITVKRQAASVRQFAATNKTTAMARAPQQLKDAAAAARRNEAGVQAANALLTEECERLRAALDELQDVYCSGLTLPPDEHAALMGRVNAALGDVPLTPPRGP